MKINSFNNNYKKINFTALKTDAVFRKVVNNAKHEILDCEYINPKIWTHTLAFVREMKKLFPEGVLETRPSPYGYIPILKPFAQKQYYKNNLGMKPAEIHLNTILNIHFEIQWGTIFVDLMLTKVISDAVD